MSAYVAEPHRLWFIDEIIRNILGHLPTNGSERTLARCSRVSRSLSEPALDHLWRRLSGLAPIFRMLPRSLVEVRKENGDGSTFVLRDAISDYEWARLRTYTDRVRKFHYQYAEGPGERLGEQAFAALVCHASLAGTTLFPKLQELTWLQFSHVAQCLPFLSTSLRRVTVYVQAAFPVRADGLTLGLTTLGEHAGLVQIVDMCSPHVEELSLDGIDLAYVMPSPVVFRRLRVLHLGSVSAPLTTVLSNCAKMPCLVSLSLTCCRASGNDNPSWAYSGRGASRSDIPHALLSVLETLHVVGAPSDIEVILAAIDSPSFHTLAISTHVDGHDDDGWTRCASLLSTQFTASLRTVRAECRRSIAVIPSRARSFSRYIQPLLPLRHLGTCALTIDDPAGIAMSDDDVEIMASSWPCLTCLEVTLRGGPLSLLPTITTLRTLAQRCPSLTTLRLPLSQDVSALERWCESLEWARTCCASPELHNLWIGSVRFSMRESEWVASFLRRLFPKVDLRPMTGAGVLRIEWTG